MRSAALRPLTALACMLLFGLASPARAQFNRVFASARSGNDLNTCNSITTPCQTLQGAVNQVAAGGAVLILDTGGYGQVTIDKALSIEAPTGIEAFIHPSIGRALNGITVQAGGNDVVVLRGLTLSGGDIGILYESGAALHVERCVIQGFTLGIYSTSSPAPVFGDLYVEDTIVRNGLGQGIVVTSIAGITRAVVDRTHLVRNQYGIYADSNSRVAVWESVASGNVVGMSLMAQQNRTSTMAVERCMLANNGLAGVQVQGDFDSPAILWISRATVTGNGGPSDSSFAGLRQLGISQLLSRINNTVEGNAYDTFGSIGSYTPR